VVARYIVTVKSAFGTRLAKCVTVAVATNAPSMPSVLPLSGEVIATAIVFAAASTSSALPIKPTPTRNANERIKPFLFLISFLLRDPLLGSCLTKIKPREIIEVLFLIGV